MLTHRQMCKGQLSSCKSGVVENLKNEWLLHWLWKARFQILTKDLSCLSSPDLCQGAPFLHSFPNLCLLDLDQCHNWQFLPHAGGNSASCWNNLLSLERGYPASICWSNSGIAQYSPGDKKKRREVMSARDQTVFRPSEFALRPTALSPQMLR